MTLVTQGPVTEIRREDAPPRQSTEDPFKLVSEALEQGMSAVPGLPFCGGAIGYLGDDLARRLEKIPDLAADVENIPDMVVGIYDWAIIVDHQERRTCLVGRSDSRDLQKRWPHLVKTFSQIQTMGWRLGEFQSCCGDVGVSLDPRCLRAGPSSGFSTTSQEGDCYQVNLAVRFAAASRGNPWVAYQYLRTYNPAPFSAYLNYPRVQVLSSSPGALPEGDGGGWKPSRSRAPDPAPKMLSAMPGRCWNCGTASRTVPKT